MQKKIKLTMLVLCLIVACVAIYYGLLQKPTFASDESPTSAPQPPVPSLTSGIKNPYIPTQTWIDAYAEEDKIKVLADIQPGSAVYMRELVQRITDMYHAVKAGNWKLANYQLEYARKNMQANRVTRPKREALFTSFLTNSIGDATNPTSDSLQEAINAQSVVAFNKALRSTISNCNACHTATDHAYIIYKLPRRHEPFIPLQLAPVKEE